MGPKKRGRRESPVKHQEMPPCKFGDACRRPDCKFGHHQRAAVEIAAKPIAMCYQMPVCSRDHCRFAHVDGQRQQPVKDAVTTMPAITGRGFSGSAAAQGTQPQTGAGRGRGRAS